MSKVKFTLSVDDELLKEMKIKAIEWNKPLNELLVESYLFYIAHEKIIFPNGYRQK